MPVRAEDCHAADGKARDCLSRQDAITVALIERAAPSIAIARWLLDRFHAMIRRRAPTELAGWLDEAACGSLAAFAQGLRKDQLAVAGALSLPWSNGQTEGTVPRIC
jgi:transposase